MKLLLTLALVSLLFVGCVFQNQPQTTPTPQSVSVSASPTLVPTQQAIQKQLAANEFQLVAQSNVYNSTPSFPGLVVESVPGGGYTVYAEGEILASFHENTTLDDASKTIAKYGYSVKSDELFKVMNLLSVAVPSGKEQEAVLKLFSEPNVEYALPDVAMGGAEVDVDQSLCPPTALELIKEKKLDKIVSCSYEKYENNAGDTIEFTGITYGPGQDCPAGCIFKSETQFKRNGVTKELPKGFYPAFNARLPSKFYDAKIYGVNATQYSQMEENGSFTLKAYYNSAVSVYGNECNITGFTLSAGSKEDYGNLRLSCSLSQCQNTDIIKEAERNCKESFQPSLVDACVNTPKVWNNTVNEADCLKVKEILTELESSKYSGSKQCGGFSSLVCADYTATGGSISIVFGNAAGQPITLSNNTCTAGQIASNGQFTCTFSATTTAGSDIPVTITYTAKSGLSHSEAGFVRGQG